MTLDDSMMVVKDVIRLLEQSKNQTPLVTSTAERLRNVAGFLAEQKRLSAHIPKALGDLSDLPDELIRELSIPKTDELEDQIMTVMRACNGEAGLDQVLVGLYRKFKVVQTRRFIQNKLYRMSKKDLVYQVQGERATYSLDPQSGVGDPPSLSNGIDVDAISRVAPKPTRPARVDQDDEIPF